MRNTFKFDGYDYTVTGSIRFAKGDYYSLCDVLELAIGFIAPGLHVQRGDFMKRTVELYVDTEDKTQVESKFGRDITKVTFSDVINRLQELWYQKDRKALGATLTMVAAGRLDLLVDLKGTAAYR